MNSVKQVPAWSWLLIVGALAVKAATTAFGGAPLSGFVALVACLVAAPFLALAFCRWRYWSHSEANILRPPAAPEVPQPVDPPAKVSGRKRRASRRPPPTLPRGVTLREVDRPTGRTDPSPET